MDSLEQSPGNDTLSHRPSGLPTVVTQIRDAASSSLLNHTNRMFASCDDLFFELAEKARSNSEQNTFFESMREIRLKKDSVIARFKVHFEDNFQQLARSRNTAPRKARQGTAESLDLVETEEMETNVAISSMVTRSRIDCQAQLYHLNRRLDYLLPNITVSDSNNPFDPQQIGQAFKNASDILELPIKGRIVLFKHFERVVAKQFHTLIATANQQLINAGVLPKVNHSVRKNPGSPPAGEQQQASSDNSQANSGNQGNIAQFSRQFSELSSLLTSVRELAVSGNLGFPLFISNGTGPALDGEELRDILTDVQKQNPLDRTGADLLQPQLDLRTLLGQTLELRQARGEKNKVEKSDEDVINLIAMFFDFVLDDKQLPIQVQALISRLQIPVLKIALRDKKFFSSANHPARRLINEIVAAGVGLNDQESESRDALVAKISDIVHDIHDNYEDGDAVFLSGVELLKNFRQKEEKRVAKIEKRTSESAEAEAKTRHTKAIIEEMVLERLESVEVPAQIQDFAIEHWQQVLLLARLKHGNESAEWIEALQTLDDLIWTSRQHEDEKSRRRLQRILPELQPRLQKWLATTQPSEDAARNLLSDIVALQDRLMQVETAPSVDRSPLRSEQKQALQTEPRPDKPWREMTAVERQQVQFQALTYDFIKKAEDMPVGTWLLFSKSADGNSMRCKLAAKIETSDSYVFVNRLGFKVMEKKRKEFAFNLQQGRAKAIQHELFFDRMMNKVTHRLHTQAERIHSELEPA